MDIREVRGLNAVDKRSKAAEAALKESGSAEKVQESKQLNLI